MGYYINRKYPRVYGETIVTPIGRLLWPYLATPQAPPPPEPGKEPGKPRYSVTWVSEGTDGLEEFMLKLETMTSSMLSEFNAFQKANKRATVGELSGLLEDGNSMDKEKYPFMQGKLFFSARNSYAPKGAENPRGWEVKNRAKQSIAADQVIGGMLGRLLVTPHIGPTGLSYRLELVQVTGDDGLRFGGASRNHDDLLDALEGVDESLPDLVAEATSAGIVPEVAAATEVVEALQATVAPVQEAPVVDAPKVVGTLTPKQIQQQIRERAAKGVAQQNAAVVTGSALKTGKGKGAAIDNL